MSGTIVIDTRQTFTAMILMSVAEKMQFGTQTPEISPAGERKYVAELAVTYSADPGMRAVSEVITCTLTGGDHNAILGITPGSVVELDRLRAGVSQPEKRENGTVRGGRMWYSAQGIRVAGPSGLRPVKSEAS